MQLWHVGRISAPSFLGGDLPVGPSAIAAKGHVSRLRPERPFPIPRALEEALKSAFEGPYIANEGFDFAKAETAVGEGWADAVAFGKAFISNPDLPERLRSGSELNAFDASTFYGGGAKGYIDYPAMETDAPPDCLICGTWRTNPPGTRWRFS